MKGILETIVGLMLAALLLAPYSAVAQQVAVLNAPSAEKIAVTSGGVDIRTGRYAYEKTDVSIGDENGAISVQRNMPTPVLGHVAPMGNLSHNWDIFLSIKSSLVEQYNAFDYVANVNFGGRSQTFEKLYLQDTAFRQKSQNDFTRLVETPVGGGNATFTFTATDGTIAVFLPVFVPNSSGGYGNARVAHIIEPDGIRYDFEYDNSSTRLRSVTSSRGYAALFEYSGAGAQVVKSCVINLGSQAKPANNICPASPSQAATYAYTGNFMTGASGPDGNTENFTYTNVQPNVSFQMAFTKPGQSTPWLTNNNIYEFTQDGLTYPITTAQNFGDGSSFTYGYNYTPQTDNGSGGFAGYQSIAGGSYSNALGQLTEVQYDFPVTPGLFKPPRIIFAASGEPSFPLVDLSAIVYQITPGPTRIVDPLGRTTVQDYCDANAMANLPPYEFNRCLVRDLQFSVDPEGNRVQLKYGVNNNVIEIRRIAKPGSGLPDTLETATYDTTACANFLLKVCNKPLTVTDAKGKVTDYTWSTTHGGMLTETLAAPTTGADRPQKRYTYAQLYAWYRNSAGTIVQSPYPVWLLTQTSECKSGVAPACVGTANETRTIIAYQTGNASTPSNLLPVSRTVQAGDGTLIATTSWTYDDLGNKLTEDGPLPGTADTTRWIYDARRRVIGVIAPDPDGAGALKYRATRNTFDAAGRLIKVEQGATTNQLATALSTFAALQTVETRYDQLDRKTHVWNYGTSGGPQSLTQYSYDLAGRPECTAVRMNPALFVAPGFSGLPASACTLGTQGSGANDFGPDRITKLVYDAAGQLTKTILAVGTADQTDQETNSYTLNGKLATVTDGENNRTTFEYDGHDRLYKTRYPVTTLGAHTSSTTDYEQLTYDNNDNVITHRKRDGMLINFSYDALNRITLKDTPNVAPFDYDILYQYDLMGRQISATTTDGHANSFVYDALGRMTAQHMYSTSTYYSYDIAGRRTRMTWADGNYAQYDFDLSNKIIAIRENGAASGIGVLATYSYDDLGRRISLTRSNGAVTSYGYDAASRLSLLTENLTGSTHDQNANFAYNPASQIASVTKTNDLYAWTSHYNINRNYGTNGLNQLTTSGATALGYDGRGNLTNSGTASYWYTSENRLATASNGTSINYEPSGNQILQLYWPGHGPDTRFGWVGDRIVMEIGADTGGNVLRRYIPGPNVDETLVWYEGAGLTDRRWLHADERGSITAISNASGAAIAVNRYDEYGIPASTNIGRFGYTGQAWISEVGLSYYKARFYSPTLGRFMQTDPIGYNDGINWYAYVGNDPVNKTDPSGLAPGDKYASGSDAGYQAIKDINGKSIKEDREYAGRIYENSDGTYSYTEPRPGAKNSSNAGGIPEGTRDAGDYHTHGGYDEGYSNDNFSSPDKSGNLIKGTPGYLGGPSGVIKKFSPLKKDDRNTPEDERVTVLGNSNTGNNLKPIAKKGEKRPPRRNPNPVKGAKEKK